MTETLQFAGRTPKHIGIIGHSAGARIGALAATRSPDVGFIVMLAGAGIMFEENTLAQREAMLRISGASQDAIARDRLIVGMILRVLKSEQDIAAAAEKVKVEWATTKATLLNSQAKDADISNEYVERLAAAFNTAEVRSTLTSDPARILQQLRVPVLAMNGSRDLQVLPQRTCRESLRH